MDGEGLFRRWGSAAQISRSEEFRVMSTARFQPSSSRVRKSPAGGPPMLTTRTSSPARAARVCSTAAAGPATVDRSTAIAVSPTEAACSVSRWLGRAASATRAPSAASVVAHPAPSPLLAQPTRARLPLRWRSMVSHVLSWGGFPANRSPARLLWGRGSAPCVSGDLDGCRSRCGRSSRRSGSSRCSGPRETRRCPSRRPACRSG